MTRRENAIRRRHPRVPKQTRQTGIGQSICIHHISDLISRVFSAFLKREASPSPSSWERDHFPTLRLRSYTYQHLCFPLYHFVTSLSLSLSLDPFIFLSPRFLSFWMHRRIRPHFCSLYGPAIPCVHRGKRTKKNEHGMESLATHPRLILLFSLSLSFTLESHRLP